MTRTNQQKPDPTAPEAVPARWDIILAGLLFLAAVIVTMFELLPVWLRAAIVLPIVLVVPGYLLIRAFADPRAAPADRVRRLWASIGAGIPLLAIIGLTTAVLPSGIRPIPVMIMALVVVGALAGAAIYRTTRPAEPGPGRPEPMRVDAQERPTES